MVKVTSGVLTSFAVWRVEKYDQLGRAFGEVTQKFGERKDGGVGVVVPQTWGNDYRATQC